MQTDEPTDTTNESSFTQFGERAHDDISLPPVEPVELFNAF